MWGETLPAVIDYTTIDVMIFTRIQSNKIYRFLKRYQQSINLSAAREAAAAARAATAAVETATAIAVESAASPIAGERRDLKLKLAR